MQRITLAQQRRLHALLRETNLSDQKRDLVKYYSGGKTLTSSELAEIEARALIAHLEAVKSKQLECQYAGVRRMRSKVFAICIKELSWTRLNRKTGLEEADLDVLNAWIDKHCASKTKIWRRDYAELQALVTQLGQMDKHMAERFAAQQVNALREELGV